MEQKINIHRFLFDVQNSKNITHENILSTVIPIFIQSLSFQPAEPT